MPGCVVRFSSSNGSIPEHIYLRDPQKNKHNPPPPPKKEDACTFPSPISDNPESPPVTVNQISTKTEVVTFSSIARSVIIVIISS